MTLSTVLNQPSQKNSCAEFFCDEYRQYSADVCSQISAFVVEHDTSITKEPIEADRWSNSTESHYTEIVDCEFVATTKILSVKVMVTDGVMSECIKDKLQDETLNQIVACIQSAAEANAKEA